MAREVQSIFPGVETHDMLIVPTCQRADMDLVRTGEQVDVEKDRLLERVGGSAANGASCGVMRHAWHAGGCLPMPG